MRQSFWSATAFFVRPLRPESIWTNQKGAEVVTVALFWATNHILDGGQDSAPGLTKKIEEETCFGRVCIRQKHHDRKREQIGLTLNAAGAVVLLSPYELSACC